MNIRKSLYQFESILKKRECRLFTNTNNIFKSPAISTSSPVDYQILEQSISLSRDHSQQHYNIFRKYWFMQQYPDMSITSYFVLNEKNQGQNSKYKNMMLGLIEILLQSMSDISHQDTDKWLKFFLNEIGKDEDKNNLEDSANRKLFSREYELFYNQFIIEYIMNELFKPYSPLSTSLHQQEYLVEYIVNYGHKYKEINEEISKALENNINLITNKIPLVDYEVIRFCYILIHFNQDNVDENVERKLFEQFSKLVEAELYDFSDDLLNKYMKIVLNPRYISYAEKNSK